MAVDRDTKIVQLEAELAASREREAVFMTENSALRKELEQRNVQLRESNRQVSNANRARPMFAEPEAYPASFEVEDAHVANELFQRNGWTDGLPIVPPTPDLVAAFLDQVGLQPEDVVGVEPVRRRRISAEEVAASAVMAGGLPAYMPLLVAILQAMCEPECSRRGCSASTGGS